MRRIPSLEWSRRHNVAAVWVSFSRTLWDPRDVEHDVTLGYNAAGRLARVLLRDARAILPPRATVAQALACVLGLLAVNPAVPARDVEVLASALARATRSRAADGARAFHVQERLFA